MRRIVSTTGVVEDGNYFWVRVTSYTPGATLTLDDQKTLVIDALLHYVSKGNVGGPTYKRVTITGIANVEVGESPDDPDPGPVNASGAMSTLVQTVSPANIGIGTPLSNFNPVVITGQDSTQGVQNIYEAPLAGEAVTASTAAGFPVMFADEGGTSIWRYAKSDSSGRLKTLVRGADWMLATEAASSGTASATQAAVAGKRHITLGGTAAFASPTVAATAFVRVRDGTAGTGTILWSCALGGNTGSGGTVAIPSGLIGSINTAMTVEFSGAISTATQSVSLDGFDDVAA